jgi:hypothetical protein
MREITDHHDGHGLTESLHIEADDLGPGGASHVYGVHVKIGEHVLVYDVARIQFQKGPRNEPGSVPGIVESVLLAIVADRMRCFNKGEYACRENALVLTKVEEAIMWLRHRADDRAKRKVLGTYQK